MSNPLSSIDPKYHTILSQTEIFVLSYPGNFSHFDLSPWGLTISERNRLSCLSQKNEKFFEFLHDLDDLSFGPMGMPMEKWIFFDCAEMPGGILGLGAQAKTLPERVLKRFKITSSYEGLVPLSMYMAVPMVGNGNWFGHNLSSANNLLKPPLPGLGLLTKALALKVFRIKTLYGATQWDSKAMHIHLQLADMEVLSAYTPAHTLKKTVAYRSHCDDDRILQALSGRPRKAGQWEFLVPSVEEDAYFMDLQNRIEEKEHFSLIGRGIKKDGKIFYPGKRTSFPTV